MRAAKALNDSLRSASLIGVDGTRAALEMASARLRDAILKCAPKPLLTVLWQLTSTGHSEVGDPADAQVDPCDLAMAMEYVHAVLSSVKSELWGAEISIDAVNDVLRDTVEVRKLSIAYSYLVNEGTQDREFSHHSGELHFLALCSWIQSRAYRYGVLELEFLQFVLEPHSDALQAAYGVDAGAVARGLQAAVSDLIQSREESHVPLELAKADATADRNNVSRTSGLPASLLDDLSYLPGENSEFFAFGPFCGTPLRTLPGRLKPLIRLDDGHYACDPYFLRDSAYRAIQRGLRRRLGGDSGWTKRQTEATEAGFAKIFDRQLAGADIFRSVYYKEVGTGNWCELDMLIILDDVLFVVEVKGGVMPNHSPEEDFDKYRAKVEDLITEAYRQSARFLEYANFSPEVELFEKQENNEKRQSGKLRLRDYRLVFPIGLTIESFVPFSAASKQLSGIEPVLGRFPFISMAIDDLFILNRFLPTAGELTHYLMVRQRIAGQKQVMLLDEADHLGLYVSHKRYDIAVDFFAAHGIETIVNEHPAKPVDEYFNLERWDEASLPRHDFPFRFTQILAALDARRSRGFVRADAIIRDISATFLAHLEAGVEAELCHLETVSHRRIVILGNFPFVLCLQRAAYVDVTGEHREAAENVAKGLASGTCRLLIVHVRDGEICDAWGTIVEAPI